QYLPRHKVVQTGNPLNSAVMSPDPQRLVDSELPTWLGQADQSDLPLIYITGGGLGSHILNAQVEELLPGLLDRYRLVHQTGSNQQYADYDRLSAASYNFSPAQQQRYYLARHFSADEVGLIYGQASLVVARA